MGEGEGGGFGEAGRNHCPFGTGLCIDLLARVDTVEAETEPLGQERQEVADLSVWIFTLIFY